jgi:cysteine-rich repeat protein
LDYVFAPMRRVSTWVMAAVLAGCGFGDNTGHHRDGLQSCGDGVKDAAEGCDDGNRVSGDGCSDTCAVESANPVCGNGTKENGEGCDDGNTRDGDGCSASCETQSLCGNGAIDAGEQCDDGNTASGDGCSPTCQTESATACSMIPQAGCGGSTPACDLTAAEDGTTACRAVSAAGTSDSRCSALTGCSAGYSCVGDLASDASCMKFCTADSGCTGTGSRCAFTLVNDNGDSLNVKVCSNACDLYAQSGCPSGLGCVGYESSAGDFTDCRLMGGKLDGQSCASTLECAAGSLCVNDGTARCHAYCKMGVSSTCPSGQTCTGFSSSLTIGSTTYGFCR